MQLPYPEPSGGEQMNSTWEGIKEIGNLVSALLQGIRHKIGELIQISENSPDNSTRKQGE